jgi:hypothetical protein
MFTGMPDFNQSVEMMKNMWSNAAKGSPDKTSPSFGFPGMSTLNPFGIPVVDIEELDKRIKDLKSVEAWLTLNLNVLQTTIQGLEVQKATLSTLHGIAETMRSSTNSAPEKSAPKNTPSPEDLTGSGGKLAQELMEQMSKSMTNMMAAFPMGSGPATKTTKKPAVKRAAKKTTPAKTARSRSGQDFG